MSAAAALIAALLLLLLLLLLRESLRAVHDQKAAVARCAWLVVGVLVLVVVDECRSVIAAAVDVSQLLSTPCCSLPLTDAAVSCRLQFILSLITQRSTYIAVDAA